MEQYTKKIGNRSNFRFGVGLIIRFLLYLKYAINRNIAILRGAKVGNSSIIPFSLAIKANKNLCIGSDCILETSKLDLRGSIKIEDHCIINKEVQIIRLSHFIDDDTLFTTKYYPQLVVKSYSWLATGCKILPSCNEIEMGSVIGAFSVLVNNTTENGVYSGSPAKKIRSHNTKFTNLVVCSLMGGDLIYYLRARHGR